MKTPPTPRSFAVALCAAVAGLGGLTVGAAGALAAGGHEPTASVAAMRRQVLRRDLRHYSRGLVRDAARTLPRDGTARLTKVDSLRGILTGLRYEHTGEHGSVRWRTGPFADVWGVAASKQGQGRQWSRYFSTGAGAKIAASISPSGKSAHLRAEIVENQLGDRHYGLHNIRERAHVRQIAPGRYLVKYRLEKTKLRNTGRHDKPEVITRTIEVDTGTRQGATLGALWNNTGGAAGEHVYRGVLETCRKHVLFGATGSVYRVRGRTFAARSSSRKLGQLSQAARGLLGQ